jgi:hypothetical protein
MINILNFKNKINQIKEVDLHFIFFSLYHKNYVLYVNS